MMKINFITVILALFLLTCFGCDDENNLNNLNNVNNINNANNVNNTNSTNQVWIPSVGTTWQWQLSALPVNTKFNVGMYDIDLFESSSDLIQTLKDDGRMVICYFSAGSFEDWRQDAALYSTDDYGNPLDGWDGEFWVDTRSENVREIIKSRLDLALEKGCDGVEPDNVDGYQNDPGFPLNYDTQLDFNIFISTEAHLRGLSVGLKNNPDQIPQLIEYFDWSLTEECVFYNECESYRPFIDSGKAVFHVEYVDATTEASTLVGPVCADPQREGFSTLIKTWDLDAWYVDCINGK
jgi:hypothetical protein